MTEPVTPLPAGGQASPQDQTSGSEGTQKTEQTQETQKAEPQFVTMEALEKFGDTLVKRVSQSSRDREKAIKQEVGQLRQQLVEAGITPTAEQEAKLRENVEKKFEEPDETQEPEVTQAGATTPANEQAVRFMESQIALVFAEVGQTVSPSDPEHAGLQQAISASWTDPNGLTKILLAATKAANAKTARLQKNQSTVAGRIVGNAAPSGGQAQPQPTSAHDAWSEAYKKA